jgi:DNA-binding XRE family transcriptional regulator
MDSAAVRLSTCAPTLLFAAVRKKTAVGRGFKSHRARLPLSSGYCDIEPLSKKSLRRELGMKKKIVDFDIDALFEALDAQRTSRGLSWAQVAKEMWSLSADLSRSRPNDHPISPATITGISKRGNTTCQHALVMLRWLGRSPESFLPGVDSAVESALPFARSDRRLRWHLRRLYFALDDRRRELGLTWQQLAREIGCSPNQLTGIRTARYAINMKLAMRIVQWLERPSSDFIYAAQW